MFKKIILVSFSIFLMDGKTNAQSFLNGNFDVNTCPGGVDQINLTNAGYNGFMANQFSFGTWSGVGDMDILTLATYGLPQSGSWYVALTGGSTDQISLTLAAPLVMGNSYTIRFYDRGYVSFPPQPIEIGLSTTNNTFGSFIASTGVVPASSVWTMRTITFNAPNNGQFLTVRTAGSISNWTQVDNFTFVSVLPIELLDFTAECKNNSVELNWSTATEKNNDFFTIERSENGFDFVEVGEVRGALNSTKKINYSFTDKKQTEGSSYYRLRQTDENRNTTLSEIIVADRCDAKKELDIDVFPNPTSDYLNVNVQNFSADSKLKILSSLGNVVFESSIENNSNSINISGFEAGIYLIQVVNENKIISQKFTKK